MYVFSQLLSTDPTDLLDAHSAALDRAISAPDHVQRNPRLRGVACIRCYFQSELLDYASGCPACASEGHAANLCCVYDAHDAHDGPHGDLPIPYSGVPNLGQGNTPLVALPNALSKALRTANAITPVRFKMESANPTGSHKDRMAAFGVAHAAALGKTTVIAASSGNAGVAVAAFAATVGLHCEIVVTPECSFWYRALIERHGATLTECANSLARWHYVAERCSDPALYALTNFALPAVGSPAVAIEGYKPIAQELIRDMNGVDIREIFVPVARGDLLWGLYLGFKYLHDQRVIKTIPPLVAVEPFPRLVRVMAGHDYRASFEGKTLQLSTAGSTVTLQAIEAVRRSKGRVEVVADADALLARDELAGAGLCFELCAAGAYEAYRRAPTKFDNAESIIIATAHGSRDLLTT